MEEMFLLTVKGEMIYFEVPNIYYKYLAGCELFPWTRSMNGLNIDDIKKIDFEVRWQCVWEFWFNIKWFILICLRSKIKHCIELITDPFVRKVLILIKCSKFPRFGNPYSSLFIYLNLNRLHQSRSHSVTQVVAQKMNT